MTLLMATATMATSIPHPETMPSTMVTPVTHQAIATTPVETTVNHSAKSISPMATSILHPAPPTAAAVFYQAAETPIMSAESQTNNSPSSSQTTPFYTNSSVDLSHRLQQVTSALTTVHPLVHPTRQHKPYVEWNLNQVNHHMTVIINLRATKPKCSSILQSQQ